MRPRILFLLIALVTVPVLALACGGGDDDDAGNGGNGNTTAGTAVPADQAVIDQDNLKFVPTALTVKAGQPVTFKNSETALHTVTINGKNESGNMKKGDEFKWTPPSAGTYKITCDYHPQMKATITVVGS